MPYPSPFHRRRRHPQPVGLATGALGRSLVVACTAIAAPVILLSCTGSGTAAQAVSPEPRTSGQPAFQDTVPGVVVVALVLQEVQTGQLAVPAQTQILAVPNPFVARPGERITWVSEHPFVVHFETATPLSGPGSLRSRPDADRRHVIHAVIRSDAARTEPYKYTVAMLDPDGGVRITDPIGVVDPDPGPRRQD
jgi:hypothetical protein